MYEHAHRCVDFFLISRRTPSSSPLFSAGECAETRVPKSDAFFARQVRTSGSGASISERCWKFMEAAVKVVDDTLRSELPPFCPSPTTLSLELH